MNLRTGFLYLGSLLIATSLPASAAGKEDKSGVTPTTVSLPAGPGSIEGLGESFQPMLNTGTARYGVKIVLPPGVAGGGPELQLRYDGGFGDGPAGIGWSYGPGPIARQTDKGIPRYVDGSNGLDDDYDGEIDEFDETDTFLGPDGEELVRLADNSYQARVEGGFTRYRRVGSHWEADLKDGTLLEFGLSTAGRVTDRTGTKVFQWLLERHTDANGNVTEYDWADLPGSDNRKYLGGIRYGPGAPPWSAFYFASFSYEVRPDWSTDYRSGFLLKTAHRLREISVGIQGTLPAKCAVGDHNGDGEEDALITRYGISYDPDVAHRSFLSRVTRYGSDGVSYLPPLTFGYSYSDPPPTIPAGEAVIGSERAPFSVMDSELVDLVDLNRDGLADILRTDREGAYHRAYLNLGGGRRGSKNLIFWSDEQPVASADSLALQLHLAEDRVSLADMNGDGISDLVHVTQAGEVFYHSNTGDVSWGPRRRMSVGSVSPPPPFVSEDVETSDLDFNKRMDTVMSTAAGYSVWFNYEEGHFSGEVRTPGAKHRGRIMRFSDPGVQLADLNGDRLNDVVQVTPSLILYAASMGHGLFADAVEIPIPDALLTSGENGQVERATLTDVDGDGLADLVVERAAAGELWCWLNRGTHEFSRRIRVTGMPVIYGPDTAVRWSDLNGNGTTDLVYADSSAFSRVRIVDLGLLLGGSAHPNLLTRVRNGLGVTTTLSYRSSTDFAVEARDAGDPWEVTVPFPVQVVAEVETTTGLDVDAVPGEDRYLTSYLFRDGFYEDRERAFRGFAEVTVTEPGDATVPAKVSRHEFYTGGPDGEDNDGDGAIDEVSPRMHREEDALKGLVRSLEVRTVAGKIFTREENSWRVRNLHVNPDGAEVRFAYTTGSDRLLYEKTAAPETIRTAFIYDDFGNVTGEQRYGALSISGDEAFTATEYINDTSRWILGIPARETVTDGGGNRVAETVSYYDGPGFIGLPYGQLTTGKLTRRQGWVKDDAYAELVRNAFDPFGNIVESLDPRGGRRSVDYDPLLHTFPVREEIEVGGGRPDLAVSAEVNVGLGVVTGSTGFNGHHSEYGHDVFGRLTSIVLPGDSGELPTRQFSYTMADPSAGLLYEYDADGALFLTAGVTEPSSVETMMREVSGAPGTFDTTAYVDGLGRPLATVTEGETDFIVSKAFLFNARGKVWRAFPSYESLSEDYARPNPSDPASESHYDATGREVLRINPPDVHDVMTSATTVYLPLMNTVTDENGHLKDFLSDGLDRLVEVREHNGAETYVTRYAFDPLGNLLETVDARSNSRTMEFDGLSRRVLLQDPDRGRMDYGYDASGNLVRTIDNKGQEVRYSYDAANRILAEYHLDGSGPGAKVTYRYDEPSADYPAAANLKGRLARVEDQSGAHFFSYDARGNLPWTARRIVYGTFSRDYVSESSFDAMGRVASSTWPDGDSVQYTYNNGSLLESIPGVVDDLDYHPSGAFGSILYGSGVRTEYAFDPRHRLTGLLTSPPSPGDPLQDLAYEIDGAGNITSISDNRTLAPGDPSGATQSFQYDDLDRLTRAEGPGYGAIDYDYDAIGNMIFKGSPASPDPQHIDDPLVNLGAISSGGAGGTSGRGVRLPGDQPGPHAVTATASGLLFGYDDNGNMTSSDGDLYEWDFNDRLVRAQRAAADARYLYDYGGRRAAKKVTEGGKGTLTLYVSRGYEVREGRPVKYLFAGNRRVARVEGRLGGEGGSQTIEFAPGWNFFSLEVEPSAPLVTWVLSPLAGKYTGVWAFDASTQAYVGYEPGGGATALTELHAQTGYLIHVTEPCTLPVYGFRTTEDQDLHAGWNLIASPSNGALPVGEALASIEGGLESVWSFDTKSGSWTSRKAGSEAFLDTLPSLEPDRSYWVNLTEAATLSYQAQQTKIFFYHPDHLGSSNLVTDDTGAVVERTEFYPYGMVRHEDRAGFESAYGFTGKEQDGETDLMYFEARYYSGPLGRFISADPLYSKNLIVNRENPDLLPGQINPQHMNLYQYGLNNPVNMVDPQGLQAQQAEQWFDTAEDAAIHAIKYGRQQQRRLEKKAKSIDALFMGPDEHEQAEHGGMIIKNLRTGKYRYTYTRGTIGSVASSAEYQLDREAITGHWHLHVRLEDGQFFSPRDKEEHTRFGQQLRELRLKIPRNLRGRFEHKEFLGTPSGYTIKRDLTQTNPKGWHFLVGRKAITGTKHGRYYWEPSGGGYRWVYIKREPEEESPE